MIRFNYDWDDSGEQVIYVVEDGRTVDVASFFCDRPEKCYLEASFGNGNFITSNRFIEEDINRIYQHHSVVSRNGIFEVVSGKIWDDGISRTFSVEENGMLRVTSIPDNVIEFYDHLSFQQSYDDYEEIEKQVVKSKRKRDKRRRI